MGYTTYFGGMMKIDPPLNEAERGYLRRFAEVRHMERGRGPYFVEGSGYRGQGGDFDVTNVGSPPAGQPGLWCQWIPTEDGAALEWDEGEKFYEAERWMAYLIEHFLRPGACAKSVDDPQFADFSFDHRLDGEIDASGEEPDDRWLLRVADNEVFIFEGRVVYGDPLRVLTS
jgi:hypothetical protein